MSSTILYVPIARDELSSVVVALNHGIERLQTKEFREDAKRVRERLISLLLMCSSADEKKDED